MFAAMLFAISTVALAQFALYYWRAVLAGVAGQPVSESVLAAAKAQKLKFVLQSTDRRTRFSVSAGCSKNRGKNKKHFVSTWLCKPSTQV